MFPDLSPPCAFASANFANFVRASVASGRRPAKAKITAEDYGLQSTVEHSTNLRAVAVLVEKINLRYLRYMFNERL